MISLNYELWMEEKLEKLTQEKEVPTLLLHCCCAPCTSAVLERLSDYFQLTVFYYNPNISSSIEYQKRILELKRLIKEYPTKYPISFLEGNYDPSIFEVVAEQRKYDVEGGKTCYRCYEMRLEESAKMAKKLGFDYFTTTLSISPYKRSDWLNEIGKKMSEKYQINYLYSDFKKKNGYHRSIELSQEYHLYRQDYCGCTFSKLEREKKKTTC